MFAGCGVKGLICAFETTNCNAVWQYRSGTVVSLKATKRIVRIILCVFQTRGVQMELRAVVSPSATVAQTSSESLQSWFIWRTPIQYSPRAAIYMARKIRLYCQSCCFVCMRWKTGWNVFVREIELLGKRYILVILQMTSTKH